MKKCLLFSQKNPLIFKERNFLIFSLYFGKGIFRILVYSEPDTYSEHSQTSTMERFAKIATWRTFWPQPSKSFPKKLSYIFGNRNGAF